MTIYTLYTCDAWKTYSSMRPYWQGTNFRKLLLAIKKAILDGDMEYDMADAEDMTPHQIAKHFIFSMGECQENASRLYLISSLLKYGYVSSNKNNSFL